MIEDTLEYGRINKIPDVKHKHWVVVGLKLLAKDEEE